MKVHVAFTHEGVAHHVATVRELPTGEVEIVYGGTQAPWPLKVTPPSQGAPTSKFEPIRMHGFKTPHDGNMVPSSVAFPIPVAALWWRLNREQFPIADARVQSEWMVFDEDTTYHMVPPIGAEGAQVELIWLPANWWAGCRDYRGHLRVGAPAVIGPRGIPVAWRELQAVPLSDDSLLGLIATYCDMPESQRTPMLVSRYFVDSSDAEPEPEESGK